MFWLLVTGYWLLKVHNSRPIACSLQLGALSWELVYLRPNLNHLSKIRVAAVSYLNTKPLLYGIKRHKIINDITLVEDFPSKIAQMLIDDQVDVGLIPVAATLKLKEWNIVSDYCIGSDGAVASVCIFSEQPLEHIEKI